MQHSILIGEMGKLHNISKETLRYYHKIGLFVPAFIDEKGYRHYSIEQFAYLDSILFLRELGFSIEDIRIYLANRTLNGMNKLLQQQKELIHKQIKQLQLIEKAIDQKLTLFNKYENTSLNICKIRQLPKRYIARWILDEYKGMKDFEYGLKHLNQTLEESATLFKGLIGVSLNKHHLTAEYFNNWDEVILVFNEASSTTCQILDSGYYATITYIGTYSNGYSYFQSLLNFLLENNYVPIGNALFLTISDTAFSSNPDEYITEIQIPCKKN